MDNLDKLMAAGLPIFDLNSEYLDRKNWTPTPLGDRDSWPLSLKCLVNSCLLPIPHCAAIFWGSDLAIIHNLAWGKATGNLDGQGASAHGSYSGEALSSLKSAVRGRTVKVACGFFLQNSLGYRPDATMLLSTLLDENGTRQGVLAQLLHNEPVERYLQMSGLDGLKPKKLAHRAKGSKGEILKDVESSDDQPDPKDNQQHNVERSSKQSSMKVEQKSKDTKAEVNQPQADEAHLHNAEKIDPEASKQMELFRRFAELVPNGLAILDMDAEAIFVNDFFFKLTTNRSSKEFRAWPESIDPKDYEFVMSEYRRAFSSREELRVEFRCAFDTPRDEEEWRLFLLRPLGDDANSGFICAVVDITEIKQAQIAQEKAATESEDRKSAQERFIDMVSHEIRNPLSAVLHLAEEIKEVARDIGSNHSDLEEPIADILDATDTILLCVSHQNTLVDDVLSFSKLDSAMLTLVPRVVQPKWEFSRALKVFNAEFKAKQISFHYAMDVSYDTYGMDYVLADLNRMTQVLVNLITNAIKFTATKNGERSITVSMGAAIERPSSYPPNVVFFEEIEQSFHIDSTMTSEWGNEPIMYLMVAVKDTGIGISAGDQAKLFERFRQATPKTQENYGGSGLGLFISRKLCQLHGGDVGVGSKEGEGSTFGFYFKVRRSYGSSENGRPGLKSRTASGSSNTARQSLTPRPGYDRSNSALHNIRESPNERPRPQTLTSHGGVDPDDMNQSLRDPPTEYREEAHPGASLDDRFRESKAVVTNIKASESSPSNAIEDNLPNLQQTNTAPSFSPASPKTDGESNITLLLVEDNIINQKVLRRQLQSRGFHVEVANNGQEAVNTVKRRGDARRDDSDQRDYFDCILMDQEMPIMDGNSATIEIRGLQAQGMAGKGPILGVSANVREAHKTSMLEAGMDAVISKPFKVDDLVAKIKTLLPKDEER